MKPLVYVAGPMTSDPYGCVAKAAAAFAVLRTEGCVPFLPQLSVIQEMVAPMPYEEWLSYDLDVIRHCDALFRLPGESKGADSEVEYAKSCGLTILTDRYSLNAWVYAWNSGETQRVTSW